MEPAVIIMDNAPCHRRIDEQFPQLEIKFLPAFSPFLIPIYNTFSMLKSAIKHLQHDTERSHAQDAREQGETNVLNLKKLKISKLLELVKNPFQNIAHFFLAIWIKNFDL